jgi:AraC family transcriptional regulator
MGNILLAEQIIIHSQQYEDTSRQLLTTPQLIYSSQPLGWQGIEVRRYNEPNQMESWIEPITPSITLKTLINGSGYLNEKNSPLCKGIPIQQGALFLIPAYSPTPELSWQSSSKMPPQTLHIHINYAFFCRTIEEVAHCNPEQIILAHQAGFQDPVLMQLGLALDREIETPSPISSLYVQSAAYMAAIHLLRYYTIEPINIKETQQTLNWRQIKKITDYIHEHLAESIQLEDLSQQVGFSPYHFTRLFRQSVGESPHQFVLRQRVEHAQHLLRYTDLPLAQIALVCGFAHQSHMTQVFKRSVKLTPAAFRQSF